MSQGPVGHSFPPAERLARKQCARVKCVNAFTAYVQHAHAFNAYVQGVDVKGINAFIRSGQTRHVCNGCGEGGPALKGYIPPPPPLPPVPPMQRYEDLLVYEFFALAFFSWCHMVVGVIYEVSGILGI